MAKGFAFVEFADPESARKALKMHGVEPEEVRDMDPADLVSIKAFQNEQAEESGQKQEDEGKKKKKNPTRKDLKAVEVKKELSMLNLRVMSKASWKKLRNSYLNLQRKNMADSKRRLKQWAEDNAVPAAAANTDKVADAPKQQEEIPFVPSSIVCFKVSEPIADKVMIKKKVRSAFVDPAAIVSYIDVEIGQSQFYVRCSGAEQAKKLAAVKSLGSSSEILSGQEEQDYWGRIRESRKQKRSGEMKELKPKRKRGRDRLLAKVEEVQNSHTYFNDE